MGQNQRDVWNTLEQQASNSDADARRRAKAGATRRTVQPKARLSGAYTLIAIVLVALILLCAHYGPIIREAIYSV